MVLDADSSSNRRSVIYWLAVPALFTCLCILAGTVIGSLVAYSELLATFGVYSDNRPFQESEGPVAHVFRPPV